MRRSSKAGRERSSLRVSRLSELLEEELVDVDHAPNEAPAPAPRHRGDPRQVLACLASCASPHRDVVDDDRHLPVAEPAAPAPAAPAPEPAAPEPEEPAPESDPEPAPRLTEGDVLRMTVRELKVHLEERDLETKGLKAALQKRLLASLAE